MHMATQRTRALTEATTAAQGALAWHGTGLPACGLSARFLDLNTHICSEGCLEEAIPLAGRPSLPPLFLERWD